MNTDIRTYKFTGPQGGDSHFTLTNVNNDRQVFVRCKICKEPKNIPIEEIDMHQTDHIPTEVAFPKKIREIIGTLSKAKLDFKSLLKKRPLGGREIMPLPNAEDFLLGEEYDEHSSQEQIKTAYEKDSFFSKHPDAKEIIKVLLDDGVPLNLKDYFMISLPLTDKKFEELYKEKKHPFFQIFNEISENRLMNMRGEWVLQSMLTQRSEKPYRAELLLDSNLCRLLHDGYGGGYMTLDQAAQHPSTFKESQDLAEFHLKYGTIKPTDVVFVSGGGQCGYSLYLQDNPNGPKAENIHTTEPKPTGQNYKKLTNFYRKETEASENVKKLFKKCDIAVVSHIIFDENQSVENAEDYLRTIINTVKKDGKLIIGINPDNLSYLEHSLDFNPKKHKDFLIESMLKRILGENVKIKKCGFEENGNVFPGGQIAELHVTVNTDQKV